MSGRAPYSTGCHACRRMKVKCDGERPGCRRCARGNRICPGYRDANELVFRSMNESVAAKALASTTAPESQPAPTVAIPLNSRRSPVLYQSLSTTWERNAIAYFFHHYVFPVGAGQTGYLAFLPGLFAQSDSNSCLSHAVVAVSIVSIANVSSLGHLHVMSHKRYGQALTSVADALKQPFIANPDSLLTAIVLLQMYETINPSLDSPNDPHEAGLAELLRRQSPAYWQSSPIRQELFRVVQSRRMLRQLTGELKPPVGPDGVRGLSPLPLRLELWRLLRQVCLVSYEIIQLIQGPTDAVQHARITATLGTATMVLAELNAWRSTIPDDWRYKVIGLPSLDVDQENEREVNESPVTEVFLFDNINLGTMWLVYWCAEIQLTRQMLAASALLEGDLDMQLRSQWQSRLQDAIDCICASVPFMMDEVDEQGGLRTRSNSTTLGAYFLIWSLHVINFTQGLLGAYRRFVLDTLFRIGYSKGIRLALRSRNRWLSENSLDFH